MVQAYTATIILTTTIFVTIQLRPYTNKVLYILELLGNTVNAFVLLSGLLFLTSRDHDGVNVIALSAILITVIVVTMVIFCVIIVLAAIPKLNWILAKFVRC